MQKVVKNFKVRKSSITVKKRNKGLHTHCIGKSFKVAKSSIKVKKRNKGKANGKAYGEKHSEKMLST
jgi:hypothetical protein